MSAWGYGAFSNDSAADAVNKLLGEPMELFTTIRKLINDEDPLVFRAGAELLIAAMDKRIPELRAQVEQRLEELAKNDEFFADWTDPTALRKAVRNQRRRLGNRG